MDSSGPKAIDQAIKAGLDLNGEPIPKKMLDLYNHVMAEESKRERSGVFKSMRNRVVRTGSKHFQQEDLNKKLIKVGWDALKLKEIKFYYH